LNFKTRLQTSFVKKWSDTLTKRKFEGIRLKDHLKTW